MNIKELLEKQEKEFYKLISVDGAIPSTNTLMIEKESLEQVIEKQKLQILQHIVEEGEKMKVDKLTIPASPVHQISVEVSGIRNQAIDELLKEIKEIIK